MGNMTYGLVITLFLNLLMIITQFSMINLAGADASTVYHCDSIVANIYGNGCTGITNTSNIEGHLPGRSEETSPTTGFSIIDVFSSILNWMLGVPGLKYVYIFVASPGNTIAMLNLPSPIGVLLGSFWYAMSIWFIIAFLKGTGD